MQISVDEAVKRLNEMFSADAEAISTLINHRVRCNENLADHETCQVCPLHDGTYEVGFLGVINGIFGIRKNGSGYIAAGSNDGGKTFTEFVNLDNQASEN